MALEKLRKGKELAEELEMDLAKQRIDWKARMGWVPGLDLKRASINRDCASPRGGRLVI